MATTTTTEPNWMDYVKLGSGAATGYASAQAQSRAAAIEAALGREGLRQTGERAYTDALSAREKDRQESASSAYKRLLQYDHINAGGTKTPMVSPYSKPIEAPGGNAKRLATDEGIVNELHQRASFGDPYFPGSPGLSDTDLNRLRVPGSDNAGDVYSSLQLKDAGAGEKSAGWLGMLAPLVTALKPWEWFKGKDKPQEPKPDGINVSNDYRPNSPNYFGQQTCEFPGQSINPSDGKCYWS